MIQQERQEVNVALSPKEISLLIDLLGDHLFWGWCEGREGSATLTATGRVSPVLQRLYRRLSAIAKGGSENGWPL